MKYKILTLTGLAGSALASLFGGWDMALQTLVIFMAIDWFTGGILLPGVFGKSPKSPGGALESQAGWKGLCRKGMTLLYVLIAARLDALMHTGRIVRGGWHLGTKNPGRGADRMEGHSGQAVWTAGCVEGTGFRKPLPDRRRKSSC